LHALTLTFARACPAPFSPTANRPSSFPRGPPRQADPGRRLEPFGPLRPPGKMRLPNVCNRLTITSTPRIVRPSNHRLQRLSPVMTASMQCARSKPWREHDRVELRLTASFQLQHGFHDRPRFPGSSACSVLRARDLEPSEQRSIFPAFSAGSEGHEPASDALCRAPSAGVYGI